MGFDVQEMAARLRELRARRNVSQKKVSDDTGICQSSISCWENGTVEGGMSYQDAWTLADYYGVPIAYLGGRVEYESADLSDHVVEPTEHLPLKAAR